MPVFYAFLDVAYSDSLASGAAIITTSKKPEKIAATYTATTKTVSPYVPGCFYKRELPCLINTLNKVREVVDTVFVDAYVWLPDARPGLGAKLFQALGQKIKVIGIAKSRFVSETDLHVARPVFRGKSNRPLYVSAAGIEIECACKLVRSLPGPYRIPAPVQKAHRLSKMSLCPK